MSVEVVATCAAPVIVGSWGVLCLLAAPAGLGPGLSRALPASGLALALALAIPALLGGDEIGALAAGGALVRDPLAAFVDALVVVLALAATLSEPRSDGRGLWAQGMLLIAAAGAMLAARAGDLAGLLVGLEVAALASGLCLAHARDDDSAARGRQAGRAATDWLFGQGLASGLTWLGAALVYGATGTVRLYDLGARVGAVFLRWGSSTAQAAVDLLQSPTPMAPGLIAHARDAAVEGMAAAALFVPGVLLLLAGLLARLGAFPLLLGRAAAAERAGTVGFAAIELVARTAALAALVRVFVAVLHAPRVVYAPYGWGTAAAVLGGVGALVCALAAARAADLRRLLAWSGAAQAAICALAAAAAANFVGHAGLRSGGLRLDDHYTWGHSAGEAAVAAALGGFAVHALASAGVLAAAAAAHAGRGLVDLAGLPRRSPLLSAALVVCLLALIGAPPTAGFPARLLLATAVAQDTNLLVRGMLALALAGAAALAWAHARVLLALLQPGEGPRPRRGGTLVAAAMALLLLGAGVFGHVFEDLSARAASGVAFRPGGVGRKEWIERKALLRAEFSAEE